MSDKLKIPTLRFKEFSDEWEEKKIGTIFKITAGGDIKSENVSFIKNDIYKYPIYANAEKRQGLYGYSDVYKIDSNVITVAGRGVNLGIAHARKCKFYPIVRLLVLNSKIDIDIDFFEYQINNLHMHIESTGVPQLTAPQISMYKIIFPQKQEQEKIASFLSSIDKKIEQLSKKDELLQSYKKGAMQKIFSREIRFKKEDGSDYPDWEEKEYSDIYTFYSTNSLSRDKLNYTDGNIKNIHYGDIHKKFKTMFDVIKEKVPFVNIDVDISKIKEENYCSEGDLIIADASEDYADIGKTIEILNLNGEKLIAGLHTFLARPNKYNMKFGFMGYLLQSYKVRKQVMTIAQGTKVLSLSTSRLGKVKLDLPCLEEQTKIANFLSSIDTKISQNKKALEETKKFKKALLQQMFV